MSIQLILNLQMMTDKQIKYINDGIRSSLDSWATVAIGLEAMNQACRMDYSPRDLMSATYLFQHVASNIGIKAGLIDEEKAVEFGNRLRQLVIDMTGIDPHELNEL
jgi:hypothetical protein